MIPRQFPTPPFALSAIFIKAKESTPNPARKSSESPQETVGRVFNHAFLKLLC